MNASNHKWVNLFQLYLEHGADPTQIADVRRIIYTSRTCGNSTAWTCGKGRPRATNTINTLKSLITMCRAALNTKMYP